MSSDQKPSAAPATMFVEDIFLVEGTNQQPIIRRLLEERWKSPQPLSEEDLGNEAVARLLPLIREEVVVAQVPARDEEEAFTFINLTTLAVNKD